jgi:hypothetical protein
MEPEGEICGQFRWETKAQALGPETKEYVPPNLFRLYISQFPHL